jgi:hypothetical protein
VMQEYPEICIIRFYHIVMIVDEKSNNDWLLRIEDRASRFKGSIRDINNDC